MRARPSAILGCCAGGRWTVGLFFRAAPCRRRVRFFAAHRLSPAGFTQVDQFGAILASLDILLARLCEPTSCGLAAARGTPCTR